jgi:hypothetical protein
MKKSVSSLMLREEKAKEGRIGKVCSILSNVSTFHVSQEVDNHA